MSNYIVVIQNFSGDTIPQEETIRSWVKVAIERQVKSADITIRIVDEQESAQLNQTFRNKSYPTNVLAFPYQDTNLLGVELLGDLAICAPIVIKEADEQHKSFHAHFAHLVVHGTLHLLGYDHINDEDAKRMENLEIQILKQLGFDNPYAEVMISNE